MISKSRRHKNCAKFENKLYNEYSPRPRLFLPNLYLRMEARHECGSFYSERAKFDKPGPLPSHLLSNLGESSGTIGGQAWVEEHMADLGGRPVSTVTTLTCRKVFRTLGDSLRLFDDCVG